MNRRNFVKISALGSIGLVGCWDVKPRNGNLSFPINVKSNMTTGHLIMSAMKGVASEALETETLIVGGGVAGFSAANSIANKDYVLVEMDDDFGGTSGAVSINNNQYSQGAHYDLSYPRHYGNSVIELLEKMEVTSFDSLKNEHCFQDSKYLINQTNEEICFNGNAFQESPLINNANKQDFISLMQSYVGEMTMPTRLIKEKHRHLNQLTFFEFINKYIVHDPQLISGIDYQMMDDYGGNCSQVSALAGVHYYACRDYYGDSKPQTFSPPEGNYYFIKKLQEQLNSESLRKSSLVFKIEQKGNKYESLVYNTITSKITKIISSKVVYAGQKNALKYIYPKYANLFDNNVYAPWVVINFELKNSIEQDPKWQNDMLNVQPNLLGFVNSRAQYAKDKVLTMYLCFDSADRKELMQVLAKPEVIIQNALNNLEKYYGKNVEEHIESAHVKVMGHAMPIPVKNYLLNDANEVSKKEGFIFAGVDNGRLPLMFEAMDSGIYAGSLING